MRFDDYGNNDSFEQDKKEYLEKLKDILNDNGPDGIYELLKKVDPKAAEKIHPNNVKRVIRALEMNKFGISKTDMEHGQLLWDKNKEKYNFFVIYIDVPRKMLYDRINIRVDSMVKEGILQEAKKIKEAHLPQNSTALQAIGYKEFFPYMEGKKTLYECVERLKQDSRRYAKRQITWFKKLHKDYEYIFGSDITGMIKKINK